MDLEELGRVRAPLGVLVVLDPGYLELWSGDRDPGSPVEGVGPVVDLAIEGPDAEAAGVAFDRQSHPLFLFDIPQRGLADMEKLFGDFLRESGLRASLRVLPERVPHRRRVDLAAGQFQFNGLWACAVRDLPRDRELRVLGERMPDGPDALGRWNHSEARDGKADVVFWGRDAGEAAARVWAPKLDEETYGWENLDVEAAKARCRELDALRDPLKFAIDALPHSDYYELMKQVRGTSTESGTLRLGEAALCGFMTTWGDGVFPVERDVAADGSTVRIRIELGNPDIVQRQRDLEERWALEALAIVSRKALEPGGFIGFLHREAADDESDSGWRVYQGDESQADLDDAENVVALPLRDLVERDPRLQEIFREPVGRAFERPAGDVDFIPAEPPP